MESSIYVPYSLRVAWDGSVRCLATDREPGSGSRDDPPAPWKEIRSPEIQSSERASFSSIENINASIQTGHQMHTAL